MDVQCSESEVPFKRAQIDFECLSCSGEWRSTVIHCLRIKQSARVCISRCYVFLVVEICQYSKFDWCVLERLGQLLQIIFPCNDEAASHCQSRLQRASISPVSPLPGLFPYCALTLTNNIPSMLNEDKQSFHLALAPKADIL